MKIYVDADACPTSIKDIIIRAAERVKIKTLFVANQLIKLPKSAYVKIEIVESGFDIADDKIVTLATFGDLVISEDIPLAARVIEKGASVISTHGEIFTKTNIQQRLVTRNLLSELRDSGIETGGPAPFKQKDIRNFANQLDRFITINLNS